MDAGEDSHQRKGTGLGVSRPESLLLLPGIEWRLLVLDETVRKCQGCQKFQGLVELSNDTPTVVVKIRRERRRRI